MDGMKGRLCLVRQFPPKANRYSNYGDDFVAASILGWSLRSIWKMTHLFFPPERSASSSVLEQLQCCWKVEPWDEKMKRWSSDLKLNRTDESNHQSLVSVQRTGQIIVARHRALATSQFWIFYCNHRMKHRSYGHAIEYSSSVSLVRLKEWSCPHSAMASRPRASFNKCAPHLTH